MEDCRLRSTSGRGGSFHNVSGSRSDFQIDSDPWKSSSIIVKSLPAATLNRWAVKLSRDPPRTFEKKCGNVPFDDVLNLQDKIEGRPDSIN